MSKVFTDQLAALPLSQVFIRLLPSGAYVAAIALEGRVLNIYENEEMPLKRCSLDEILQYLMACGCPRKSFVGDAGGEIDALARLVIAEPLLVHAAM
ncbi:MAG: hypothetical protein ACI8RU_002893 [Zhongshania aliphaticivorans]|jgi:hypothetical protein|uniref:hypothetical protein n=1 Tax=Zhongshania aliphaticivorans TaxID=1470434 RepID=UPI0039C9DE6D|tara:strand:+ start:885 stop:1175 length:291 start_codon:yes stop_codon:yes gene_type:complete